jgi:hypothetical protein
VSIFFGRPEKRHSAEWFAVGEGSPGSMTEERAACLAPVFATFRHLVDYISTLPADFYRVEGDKRIKVGAPELIRNVDAEYGLVQWIGQAIYGIAARGNSVGEITGLSGWGLPTMIRWSGNWSGGDSTDWWLDGRAKPDSLVAHIPWIVPSGKRLGLSPIEHYAAIVRAGLSAQDYADVRRSGALPPALLKNSAKTLDPSEAQIAQTRAVASFSNGKPFVTGNDWDLTVMSIPPNHAQFIETLKLSANQIAAIYGVDPREIGGSAEESLTYTNDESRALNRAQNARPYVTRFETAVNRWLPANTVMKLNLNASVRADLKTRTEVIGAQLQDGRLNLDEARALEDREPLPDGQGQRYNVLTPLSVEPTQRKETP